MAKDNPYTTQSIRIKHETKADVNLITANVEESKQFVWNEIIRAGLESPKWAKVLKLVKEKQNVN